MGELGVWSGEKEGGATVVAGPAACEVKGELMGSLGGSLDSKRMRLQVS